MQSNKPDQSQADNSIERSLIYLSSGVVFILAVFIAMFLWVEKTIVTSTDLNGQIITPIRSQVKAYRESINDLYARQAKVASAQSSKELEGLADRSHLESSLIQAETSLQQIFAGKVHDASAIGVDSKNLQNLAEAKAAFLAEDQKFFEATLDNRKNQERLSTAIIAIESDLKDFLQSTQGISGKIRFAQGSSLREIKRLVAATGFSKEATQKIQDNLLASSGLKTGIVIDILAAASELNRLSGKIGLVRTEDQLNSLILNELVQTKEKLAVNLDELYFETKGNPEIQKLVESMNESLKKLSTKILDAENKDSLISMKRAVFANLKAAEIAQRKLGESAIPLNEQITKLVGLSDQADKKFNSQLTDVGNNTFRILMILSLGAGVALTLGGLVVRRNLGKLKQQNLHLIKLKEDLVAINANLEKIVEERTRAIRTILDHVSFGLMICDHSFVIQDGYSQSCHKLLSHSDSLTGKKLTELLRLSPRQAENNRLIYEQVFDDTFGLGEIALDQLPSRYNVDGVTLGLVGSVIKNAQDKPVGVLFCLSDISNLAEAEEEIERNRSLIRMVANRDSFRQFVGETHSGFSMIKNLLADKTPNDGIVRRELHTLKGNSSSYGLVKIAEAIHMLEDEARIEARRVSQIEESFKEFLNQNKALLGVTYGSASEDSFVVPTKIIKQIEDSIPKMRGENDLRALINDFLSLIRLKQASTLIGPIHDSFDAMAQRLGKMAILKFYGGDTLIPPHRSAVLKNLIHLLRNALDHGIEPPNLRGDKDETGKVILTISRKDGKSIEIKLEDDGRGIDQKTVLAKAIERGVIKADEAKKLSPHQINELIFMEGVSTAEQISDISGRGVGMGAVREAVLEAGGTIEVQSSMGQGTTIILTIPSEPPTFKGVPRAA